VLNSVAVKTGSAAAIKPTFKAVNTTIGDYAAGTAAKSILTKSELANVAFVSSFNGVVDVAIERKQFVVTAPDTAFSDTAVLDLTTTGVDKLAISALTYDVTVTGDFTKLDTDGDMKIEAGEGSITATKTAAYATDLSSVVFKATNANATETVTINLPAAKADRLTLAPQSYATTITADYTATAATTGVAVLTSAPAGFWTLNGSSDNIAFLPFGSKYSQSVIVTNSGTVSGEITIDITANGSTCTTTLAQTATAKSVVDISAEVRAWAATNAVTGPARVAVVVNSPTADITVKGLYYSESDKDRAVVY
jgi:hypothetical protein